MNRQIRIFRLSAEAVQFTTPFEEDYALLLVISAESVTDEARRRVALEVVGTRCQFALTFGHDCEAWHDAMDAACFEDGIADGRFLMTTWHDKESIEDVIDYLWWNTSYGDFQPERLAIVEIGSDSEVERWIAARLAYHQERQA